MTSSPLLQRPRARLLAVLALSISLTAGCFSFDSGGMIHFSWGLRSGTTTILRHASRDLAFYTKHESTDYVRGRSAAALLRTASSDIAMPSFFRDRWVAATAPDQYVDIGEDIPDLWGRSRCLAMRLKIGWGDVGYSWFTYQFGDGGCSWGWDPVPEVP